MKDWLADAVSGTYRLMLARGAAHLTDTVAELTGKPAILFTQFAMDYAAAFK